MISPSGFYHENDYLYGYGPSIGDVKMITFCLLTAALLFGGMTLYAFGFAAFIFIALTVENASFLI